MLPYFPFPPVFDLKMGTAPLGVDHPLAEIDGHYAEEVATKRALLQELPDYYYRAEKSSVGAQWEVLAKLADNLAKAYPDKFVLEKNNSTWKWENLELNEAYTFEFGNTSTLPCEPLDWIGRQVQEDLIILDSKSHLIAGQLCFPSGWSLDEKFGKHFFAIHAPLPSLLTPMLQAADKLIERIPAGRPIARTNWGFRVTDQLDLSARHAAAYLARLKEVSADLLDENAGDHLYLRIERQTLSRLPVSNSVLFTIHTYNNLVKDEAGDKGRASAMLTFLKTVPEDLLEYKQMAPFAGKLVSYLEGCTK